MTDLVNILLVNWQDRENPHAGGAEIHLFEIFGRLAAPRPPGAAGLLRLGRRAAARDASTASASSGSAARHSFALLGRGAVRRAIAAERPDVLVEDINKLPLFLARGTPTPVLRHRAAPVRRHRVRGGALADRGTVWAGRAAACRGPTAAPDSTPSARAPGTISSPAAFRRERIRVIHPGVDSAASRPVRRAPRAARRPSCTLAG